MYTLSWLISISYDDGLTLNKCEVFISQLAAALFLDAHFYYLISP